MKTDNKYLITKSTVECYKIRHESGMYWADITIDAKERSGRIQIASDYGDYQYYWGACGLDFKSFLSKLDIYYTAGKMGASDWFDHDGTIRRFKVDVLEQRRSDSLTQEEARAIFDEIEELKDYDHKEEFIAECFRKDNLMTFYDYCPELMKDITPQFKRFWKDLWPILLSEFENEKVLTVTR